MVISLRSDMLSAPGPESSWQEDAFSYPVGASGSSFIYLLDLLSSRRLMVDSGASILVSPAPGYGWLQLMVPLSPVPAPELFLCALAPTGLTGLFS